MISISAEGKFKFVTNWHTGTSANSIVKPSFTIFETNWSRVIIVHFSKQFLISPSLDFSVSALIVAIDM